ncbi:hypothetical protein [Flavobacterium hydatis]|uniref:CD-NTase associated protein 4-like DNA endonuclease domain-containing protein n=1 Tax=Flavobacterium hydatis TaxID=991 RepID=A0A086ADY0_FLAHY|nr:hypothetical protein [Flavobacterium hydatis]KFF14894.1 hypothetical protein IW20_16460 [Flavobacterium hydatis]OXA87749.1 hypothetical protein B0A62_22340 [Flavobacterium hydatis]
MSIKKLHIFSKNTDAFASQRGYNYQTLKTLETWVNNFSENIEEDIFCEYEEDIFQKNNLNDSIKFRQIKLYSSNFSFKSDEIKKCISHFFMLHIKTEYNSFDKEFIFETNSEIARVHLNNEADLLKEWFENQNNLSEEQTKRIAVKVKDIVTKYVEEQEKNITKDNNKEIVNEAVALFNTIEESFWIEFIKLIKWKFLGETSNIEFENAKSRTEQLLYKLDYKITGDNIQQVFGVLLERVFTKASQEKSEDRKLTTNELDLLILDVGNKEDKWYSEKYAYYSKIGKIEEFRIGEFYEIIDLVNYCRRKKYLIRHKINWNLLLGFYINNEEIDETYVRKAIYECIFLNSESHEIDYDNLNDRDRLKGNLSGIEDRIRYYFQDFSSFKSTNELEKAQNILNILLPYIYNEKTNISKDEFKIWNDLFYEEICKRLLEVQDNSEKCHLLEEKGNFLLLRNSSGNEFDFIECFEEILKIIDVSPLYKISQFGDRINKYIKIFINIDPIDQKGIINSLETFSEKLYPYVEKREGKSRVAKQQVEKGISFLKTNTSYGLLKALENFHKAKDNYQQEDTIEGFILALLNISNLYNNIGMYLAGKYYALSVFRISINKEFIKYIEKSLGLMFHSDYKQGSWFNAIDIYDKYIYLRNQSNLVVANYEEEGKINQRLSFILYSIKKMSSQFNYFIDDYIKYLDYIGDEIVKPIFNHLDIELDNDEKFGKFLENNFDDVPLNDVGKQRIISFYALGSLWEIIFDNNHYMLSIAEEYIATIQIILAEISLFNMDFHFIKSKVNIELIISENDDFPILEPSNESINWKVHVHYFDSSNALESNKHIIFNLMSLHIILDSISLLEKEEFQELFFEFIKERDLHSKQTSINLYQRIHRDIYLEEDFNFSQRENFQKEDFEMTFLKENKVMQWNDSISSKYNQEFAIEAIKNRFENTYISTYKTLEDLKENKNFHHLINDLRREGWKDWQIITNIHNFIINYKINKFEKSKFIDEEEVLKNFQEMYIKYCEIDEKDRYVKFPLEAFKTVEFLNQFEISFGSIIQTYGLEFKSITPNFKAIKEFLDVKFNFINDDYNENNPLKDIKFE